MNKQFSSIIYFYGKHKDNLKFIPIIGLIFIFGIVFIMGSKEIIFLTKFNNALTIFFNYLSELFDISDILVLVRNIIIIITIWTGYVFWLKRIGIVRTNSWLVKIILCLVIFLFITEHITNSPIERFVDLAIYLAFILLILAVLFFSSKVIYSRCLSSLVSEAKHISKGPSSFNYRSGAPLTDPKLDGFERYPFAQRVAETIALHREPDSIVIGIYGEWGAGKSTILSFIERELQMRDDVIFVKFNPWLFKDDIHLLQNFFRTIANQLGRSISSPNEKIGEWLKAYSAYLSFTIGGIVQLSPGEVGKNMSAINIDELRNRIENVLIDEGKRIVILIDDVDRLDKSEIQMIFKLVKLSADFKNTTYVLAFDEEMVSEALGDKYSSGEMNNFGNKEAGKSFIEKIVQVPLRLPKADIISLRNICIGYVVDALGQAKIDISDEQYDKFTNIFIRCIEPRLQTPRMAIRYGNVLLFSLSLLKDETNPVDLMLIEGMRIFYPKLYDIVR